MEVQIEMEVRTCAGCGMQFKSMKKPGEKPSDKHFHSRPCEVFSTGQKGGAFSWKTDQKNQKKNAGLLPEKSSDGDIITIQTSAPSASQRVRPAMPVTPINLAPPQRSVTKEIKKEETKNESNGLEETRSVSLQAKEATITEIKTPSVQKSTTPARKEESGIQPTDSVILRRKLKNRASMLMKSTVLLAEQQQNLLNDIVKKHEGSEVRKMSQDDFYNYDRVAQNQVKTILAGAALLASTSGLLEE